MRLQAKAGLLYVLPAIAVVVVWYILLFTSNAQDAAPGKTLEFVLSESTRPWSFRWLLAFPFLCLGLTVAYFSRLALNGSGAVALFVVGLTLATASWLTVSSEIALFTTLPLVYAFLVARAALTLGRRET